MIAGILALCAVVYVPHFYALALDGASDDTLYPDDGEEGSEGSDVCYVTDVFQIGPLDTAEYPELDGITELRLWEDSTGFVCCAARTL